MKKALTILLVALLAITSVFAARNKGPEFAVGLQSGYAQQVLFLENADNQANSIIPIKADAMIYLGDSFAINAALGADIYVSENSKAKAGLVADILAYYNLEVGDNMNLLVGGGASYRNTTWTLTEGTILESKYSLNQLALLGSVRFEFGATDNILAFAGLDIGYNVLNSQTISVNSTSHAEDFGANVMPWAIKAGASYKF